MPPCEKPHGDFLGLGVVSLQLPAEATERMGWELSLVPPVALSPRWKKLTETL